VSYTCTGVPLGFCCIVRCTNALLQCLMRHRLRSRVAPGVPTCPCVPADSGICSSVVFEWVLRAVHQCCLHLFLIGRDPATVLSTVFAAEQSAPRLPLSTCKMLSLGFAGAGDCGSAHSPHSPSSHRHSSLQLPWPITGRPTKSHGALCPTGSCHHLRQQLVHAQGQQGCHSLL